MSLNIKIENFEGPFDLLLHLIKKNEMSIYDIRIHDITTQYLDYINSIKDMDLEVTSEFIVIAAALLEIKSKMMLPKDVEQEEESEDEDPRAELMEKLIAYRRFKLAADYLRKREGNVEVMFSKKPEIIEDTDECYDNEDLLKGITILKLFNVYSDLLNKYTNKMNTVNHMERRISVDKFKIEDKIIELSKRLKHEKRLIFSEVIKNCESKMEIVVSFLALLELIKLRTISVMQEENFNEIYIEVKKDSE